MVIALLDTDQDAADRGEGDESTGDRGVLSGRVKLMGEWDLTIQSRIDLVHVDDAGADDLDDMSHYG